MVKLYPLLRGLASYILPAKLFRRPGSGGTFSSEYCYSVWLRHLVQLKTKGLIDNMEQIKNLAEIGPGDSLGIGLAAIYTGVENYYAFDVIKHANLSKNNIINNELLSFFQSKKEIPHGSHQLRNTNPVLENYKFPENLLNHDSGWYGIRHDLIKKYLDNNEAAGTGISYVVPWMGKVHNNVKDIDLIISQAVMEHVDDIDFAYAEMYRWLKVGGIVSHQVDFKAHEMTEEWDGHFYLKDSVWSVLAHGRKYPMNRLPLTAHLKSLEKNGFKIKNIIPVIRENSFPHKKNQITGVEFSKEDYITSSALIQAVK